MRALDGGQCGGLCFADGTGWVCRGMPRPARNLGVDIRLAPERARALLAQRR